jgi:hypothetical protein
VPRALLLARGRQWLLFRLSVLNLAACATGWMIGFAWGPLGVAAGSVAASLVMALLTVRVAVSELSLKFGAWARGLLPPVVGTAAMAAGMILVPRLMPGSWPTDGVLRAALLLLVGVLCYGLPLAPWLVAEVRRHRGLLDALATTGEADVLPLRNP